MLKDLSEEFNSPVGPTTDWKPIPPSTDESNFCLKENPGRKILLTVQVERNGFIQAMVSGTTNEGRGYEYFGGRAYTNYISGD
ncbi:MAG: hypothetical protein WDN00_12575 [Limisphaerales bacterium]